MILALSACLLPANAVSAQSSAELAEALKGFGSQTSFTCQTKASGIQGCWDVPACGTLEETSHRTIIEFTADDFFLTHLIQYNARGCKDRDVAFVITQTPPEEWNSMYEMMDREIRSGGRRMIYQDIFFKIGVDAMAGETLGYKLEGGQLCFLPSQITSNDFSTLSDGLLGKWAYEEEYFFSGQYLRDMTACLSRSTPF